jgi:DNA polymerase III subunit epsilon
MKLVWFRFRKIYYLYLLRRKKMAPLIRKHLQTCLRLDLQKTIPETEFVVFDTETTGLHARRGDRIVSISAVRIKEGRIDLSDTFHELVNPNRNIPSTAAVIHGILPRMVDGKPTVAEILPGFIEFIGSSVLVGHHAWLDMTFLNREMVRAYGFPIQNLVLDTAILDQAFRWMKAHSSQESMRANSSLSALAERYHVQVNGRHSSFGDALATAQIFQQMLKQAQKQGIFSLKEFLRKAYQPLSLDSQDVSSM